MKPTEVLDYLINRSNMDPLNSKKILFNFEQETDENGKIALVLTLGTNIHNAYIFKQFFRPGDGDLEKLKEVLYQRVIDFLFDSIHDRLDTSTLSNGLNSTIVRVFNEENKN